MSEHVFRLPDLGEGTVEAEVVEWHVEAGDVVKEGDIIADVMTDKANIEVPSPVTGRVLRTTGQPGDLVAVGAELIAFEVAGIPNVEPGQPTMAPARTPAEPPSTTPAAPIPAPEPKPPPAASNSGDDVRSPVAESNPPGDPSSSPTRQPPGPSQNHLSASANVRTSPAVRKRAKEAGMDLGLVSGTGPRGRILMKDLEVELSGQSASARHLAPSGVGEVTETKVIGVRRLIANRLQAAKQQIPHFAYVEEVDITALEALRQHLNDNKAKDTPSLTYLPFVALALIRALKDTPQCNAHYDGERGVLLQFTRVHLGVATQTPDGLKVPVVHNADSRSLWQLAREIGRVAQAARDNTAKRDELTGSTITLTSLGRLGGIASTPVINAPETAIVGINKAVNRPMVIGGEISIRLMMNLSSSFDHRFVDGHDAASLIQKVRSFLEQPATIFIES